MSLMRLLSRREFQVLTLNDQGSGLKEIAGWLEISLSSVKEYRDRVCAKTPLANGLPCHNLREAAWLRRRCVQLG